MGSAIYIHGDENDPFGDSKIMSAEGFLLALRKLMAIRSENDIARQFQRISFYQKMRSRRCSQALPRKSEIHSLEICPIDRKFL